MPILKSLYDTGSAFAKACLPLAGFFNKKLQLGAKGREQSWHLLDTKVKSTLPKIWVHVASLGEYEQVVPVLEKLNRKEYQVILTFFSPSGYENKKDTALADVVTYLPIDAVSNVSKFMDLVEPSLAIMVKYEFWPNYLNALKRREVKTILVSGIFREKMSFHCWYGSWMTSSLEAFDHFFLQNESSLRELKKLGFENASVSGDTRFDRASQLIERDNRIELIDQFVGTEKCLVIGSSWPADMQVLKDFIKKNKHDQACKIIIAPHEIHADSLKNIENNIGFKPVYWSDIKEGAAQDLEKDTVLVVDTIGLLTKIYSYADVAYVGGAMGNTGLHNILEAATYGVPVIIGKNYEKYPEAGKLEDLGGLFSISTADEFSHQIHRLLTDDYLREKTGMICGHWINSNTGATREIVTHLKSIDEKLVIN
ncbi:3-deoxy-D-manno-octulosonic acid transferase [Nonlabens ponticola]|uniref:3-deoxy-D-manno-octulosonic acid transferase n=1 Tax=Nonlabens ponticola TaxID=2496866 RepID=A0A3S9MV04_9FLAO|nr:glycosyltransferase N-terminal domain-containing protein [Nonlabens ponticola]AZQ42960.1 3-deoxy-D-manno-octulosonic acid transferase [Nonlabens ponticola]